MMKIFVLLGLFLSLSANATVIYTYTGNNFASSNVPGITTDDNLTAVLTLDQPLGQYQAFSTRELAALPGFDFKMTAGDFAFSSSLDFLYSPIGNALTTDFYGAISSWWLVLIHSDPGSTMVTCTPNPNSNVGCGGGDLVAYRVDFTPGTIPSFTARSPDVGQWTVAEIPIPGTIWLIGSALLGVSAVKRKRRFAEFRGQGIPGQFAYLSF